MSQCQRKYYPLEVEETQEKCLTYCDVNVMSAYFKLVHDAITYTINKTNLFEIVL